MDFPGLFALLLSFNLPGLWMKNWQVPRGLYSHQTRTQGERLLPKHHSTENTGTKGHTTLEKSPQIRRMKMILPTLLQV